MREGEGNDKRKKIMDPPGIEPGASRMRSERDTITLRTQCREGSLFFTDKLSQSVSQGRLRERHSFLWDE